MVNQQKVELRSNHAAQVASERAPRRSGLPSFRDSLTIWDSTAPIQVSLSSNRYFPITKSDEMTGGIVDLVAFDRTRAQTKSVESWQSEGEMSDATRAYLGSWPEFYDRLLVPVLFEPYARLLAGRLQGVTSGNILEIAAGTGVVTRELIRTLPEAVGITATDLNQPMLDRAQSYAGAERVRWQQADALALPFGDCSFECIVCQFGVMFFADKQAAFREALRVLKPDGCFLFSVWDRREEIAIQYIASEVVGRLLSLDPGSLLSPPYHDRVAVYSDLTAAGFVNISIETLPERWRTNSAREAAVATCHGSMLRSHIESRAPNRLDEITNAVTTAVAEKYGPGPIDAPMQAILFTSGRPTAL